MQTVFSKDGTSIAFDRYGKGPVVILVDGALETRFSPSKPVLCKLLEPYFTVFNYDRRGRGDSGDTKPYSVTREIEDIEAIVDNAGGAACLYCHSSGGVLGMEAALTLKSKIKKIAIYEVPYNDDPAIWPAWKEYLTQLSKALSEKRNEDAVSLFMKFVGLPEAQISSMRISPHWKTFEAIAPTLAYDHSYSFRRRYVSTKRKRETIKNTGIDHERECQL
jgi:pimeloyl-ACP methyl ester carboxylesterase